MPANQSDTTQSLIRRLIACDEQPSGEALKELRQRLGEKMTRMKRRGRSALFVSLAGALLMLLGYITVLIAASNPQEIRWLTTSGFTLLLAGAGVTVLGCVGLLSYRGFGYVWARHEFQETALTELAAQIRQLTDRVEELSARK